MRKTIIAALVVALAAFAAPPAHAAGVAVGDKAPTWEVKDLLNTTSVDVQTLKGRVVLLEIFRTW